MDTDETTDTSMPTDTDVPTPGRYPPEFEYSFLRAEILQYMEEYQNLRNMMYVGTGTLLGLNGAIWGGFSLFYLLPLVIILPSFIIFYDYWKSVSVASIYIQVFLEKDKDGSYRDGPIWESMHRKFNKTLKEKMKKEGIPWGESVLLGNKIFWKKGEIPEENPLRKLDYRWAPMGCHKIPYHVCAALCLVVYFGSLGFNMHNGVCDSPVILLLIGFLCAGFCFFIFWFYRHPDMENIEKILKEIRPGA